MSVRNRIAAWLAPELRQGYTDAITQALVERAEGGQAALTAAVASGTAAVQGGANLYAMAVGGARVEPEHPALTPAVLAAIARETILYGESFRLLTVNGAGIRLEPLWGVTVHGNGTDRADWRYNAQRPAPDGMTVGVYQGARVVHAQHGYEPSRPWEGVAPWARCQLSSELLAGIERGLKSELARQPRYALPVPSDPGDDSYKDWKSQLSGSKPGALVIGKTFSGASASGLGQTPRGDWDEKRLGPNPPASVTDLRGNVQASILFSMGIDPAVLATDPASGALKEAQRTFVSGPATSLAAMLAEELSAKLEVPVRLRLRADLDNTRLRAASFKLLVDAGVERDRAMELVGFD